MNGYVSAGASFTIISLINVLLSAVVFRSIRATPRFMPTLISWLLRVWGVLSNSTIAAIKSGAELLCSPSPMVILRNSSSVIPSSWTGSVTPVRKYSRDPLSAEILDWPLDSGVNCCVLYKLPSLNWKTDTSRNSSEESEPEVVIPFTTNE